jgi:hypothetical protein
MPRLLALLRRLKLSVWRFANILPTTTTNNAQNAETTYDIHETFLSRPSQKNVNANTKT